MPCAALRRPLAIGGLALALVSAAPRMSRAASPADEAAAETLFAVGKGLMTNLRYDEACAKLDASRRLSPGIGITMWLADCQEKAGRLASAWIAFRDAASLAATKNDERARLAEARARTLEPRLARVRVVRDGFAGEVYRDEVRIPDGALEVSTPVDRGRYRYRFVARDGAVRVAVVTVTEDGRIYDVRPTDGALAPDAHAADPPTRAPDRTLGFVLLGVGAVGMVVGAGFGVDAVNGNRSSNDGHCSGNICDPEGVALRDGALRSATISTIAFVIGAAALAVGTAAFLGVFDPSTVRARGAAWDAGGSLRW